MKVDGQYLIENIFLSILQNSAMNKNKKELFFQGIMTDVA